MKVHSYLGQRQRLVRLLFTLVLSVMMVLAPITAFADDKNDDGTISTATDSSTADTSGEDAANPDVVAPDEAPDGDGTSDGDGVVIPGAVEGNGGTIVVPEQIASPTDAPTLEAPLVTDPVTPEEPTAAPEAETETDGATPAASRWESEPNASMAQANYLPLGDTLQGSSASSSSNDYDYYRIEVPSDGRLTVNFTFPSNLGTSTAYDLTIYDANGNEVYDFNVGGGSWDGSYIKNFGTFTRAGTWYIKIYSSWSRSSWGETYNLTVNHKSGLVETEFNDSTATADSLALGKTIQGSSASSSSNDYDYYRIEVPSDGRLTVNFTFPSNLGTSTAYDLTIYDANGNEVYDFNVGGGSWDGSYIKNFGTFTRAGTWYIKIYSSWSRSSWGETYNLTVNHKSGLVETEFNDSTATADSLALGKTIQGSSASGGWGDDDYFRIEVPSDGRLTVNFTFPSNLGTSTAYKLYIYNANGTEVYRYDLSGNDSNGSWLRSKPTSFTKGTWYIKIYGTGSYVGWGETYNLTVSKPQFTGWKQVGGDWYYVIDGKNATGWTGVGGTWYYMNSKGVMQTGWFSDGGTWYYLKPSGAMATGWTAVGGTWYYMSPSGVMRTGWTAVGGSWYYLKPSGAMQTGWLQQGSTWYYFKPSGVMVTGNYVINGKTNRFSSSGVWLG